MTNRPAWLTPALVLLAVAMGIGLVRQIRATAVERERAQVAETAAKVHKAVSEASLARSDSLEAYMAAQSAETERIREDADREIEESDAAADSLQADLDAAIDSLRTALPDSLRPAFVEMESLYDARLAAAEVVIVQQKRKLRAADALDVTRVTRIAGLVVALEDKTTESDAWLEAFERQKDAGSTSFFEGIGRNLPGYVLAAATGLIVGVSLMR